MMKNIVVCGKAGSGKDTVGEWLVREHGYMPVALAYELKRVARELWPDLDWSQKQRNVLQQLGSNIRDIDPQTWIKLAWRHVEDLNNGADVTQTRLPCVITDCRYLNELEFFHLKNCLILRVEASYVTRVTRLRARDGYVDEAALQHISETQLDRVQLPVIDNNGTFADLYAQLGQLSIT